jgi:hypothetical protein
MATRVVAASRSSDQFSVCLVTLGENFKFFGFSRIYSMNWRSVGQVGRGT